MFAETCHDKDSSRSSVHPVTSKVLSVEVEVFLVIPRLSHLRLLRFGFFRRLSAFDPLAAVEVIPAIFVFEQSRLINAVQALTSSFDMSVCEQFRYSRAGLANVTPITPVHPDRSKLLRFLFALRSTLIDMPVLPDMLRISRLGNFPTLSLGEAIMNKDFWKRADVFEQSRDVTALISASVIGSPSFLPRASLRTSRNAGSSKFVELSIKPSAHAIDPPIVHNTYRVIRKNT